MKYDKQDSDVFDKIQAFSLIKLDKTVIYLQYTMYNIYFSKNWILYRNIHVINDNRGF